MVVFSVFIYEEIEEATFHYKLYILSNPFFSLNLPKPNSQKTSLWNSEE